jgi:uncharacterized protein (TIGR00255 family)
MTGFGIGDEPFADGRVVAEIRSVNQRFLDVRARMPRELADLTLFAEQVAREQLRRGRVELVVRTEGAVLVPCTLDKARARSALRALGELRDELAPGTELPLSLLAAVPDLFVPPAGPEIIALRTAVKSAIERAIAGMDAMCRREGDALLADLAARAATVKRLVAEVGARAEGAREGMRRRLRERIDRLLAGSEVATDPSRLEVEIALLAERGDISEELTRLGSHVEQFEAALTGPEGEPVGRRLDFLLQEMVREANTLGAKAQDAQVSQLVVAMKVELERLREQVQNVE